MNCTNCFWWNLEWGCNNTNWISGHPTDPATPVRAGLSYRVIPIATENLCTEEKK